MQYADNTTQTCVSVCPIGFFGDSYYKTCVLVCYNNTYALADANRRCVTTCPSTPTDLYADDLTQSCVISTSCSNGRFGDSSIRKCVDVCNPNSIPTVFANPATMKCTSTCSAPYYADNSTGKCVLVCPTSPNSNLFADNITQTCVSYCPANSYADPTTQICIATCPNLYYSDNSTNACVKICP
jgi:hypothetical protein